MSCPATGIKDFPIQNNVTVTQTLNQSIFEPSSLEVQWAQRGTVPAFQQNALTEGTLNAGGQTTTLRLRGNTYTLKLVKLAEPQHNTLLVNSEKTLCIAEVVLIFESASALVEKFVFLCIPILNRSSTSPSPYLESIRQDRLPGRPISLQDLLPVSKQYISYTTCLRQVTAGKTNPVQTAVLVFTGGLSYPQTSLREVLRKMTGSPTSAPPLGTLIDGLIAKTESTSFLVTTEADYKNFFRVSDLSSGSQGSSNRRIDSTDSYKCVPLNPDETVKNNRIVIDTDKGIPLSQVLKEKKEEAGEAKITPGMVERMIAILLGTAAGIFILSVLAYLFSRVTSDTSEPQWVWLMTQTRNLVPMVLVSMVVGVIGFLIGFFTSTS
jgi:hypothetical protein